MQLLTHTKLVVKGAVVFELFAVEAIEIKGEILWAFNRQSTADILGFVESSHRRERNFQWAYMLRHLPKLFLESKNREIVSKRLRRLLERQPA